jgi:isoleucyl-tRNA synthetase
VESDGPYVAALDPVINAELAAEGLVRELVSQVQRLRKEAGYAVADRIEVAIDGPAIILDAARAHQDFIRTETLARRLELGREIGSTDLRQAVELDGKTATLSVRRHHAAA